MQMWVYTQNYSTIDRNVCVPTFRKILETIFFGALNNDKFITSNKLSIIENN